MNFKKRNVLEIKNEDLMTEEKVKEFMKLLEEAFEQMGKKIQTAVLIDASNEPKLLIDNREEKDIN